MIYDLYTAKAILAFDFTKTCNSVCSESLYGGTYHFYCFLHEVTH